MAFREAIGPSSKAFRTLSAACLWFLSIAACLRWKFQHPIEFFQLSVQSRLKEIGQAKKRSSSDHIQTLEHGGNAKSCDYWHAGLELALWCRKLLASLPRRHFWLQFFGYGPTRSGPTTCSASFKCSEARPSAPHHKSDLQRRQELLNVS